MALYLFWFDEERHLAYINEEDKRKIEKLLDEYRNNDDAYNLEDWYKYLESKGYKVEGIHEDYSFYF